MTIRTTARPTIVPSILLAALAIVELVHDVVLRRTWPGFDRSWALGVGLFLIALWGTGAVGAALRKPWAWLIALVGSLGAMVHGSVLRIGFEWMGVVYFVLGAASVVLLALHARAFGFHLDPVERRTLV